MQRPSCGFVMLCSRLTFCECAGVLSWHPWRCAAGELAICRWGHLGSIFLNFDLNGINVE